MATGWLKGVVKEVQNGDTLVIMAAGGREGAIPPEKRITLASLMAPRLGRRDGSQPDEPFAWDSREFLRNKAIGKECTFKVDYLLEAVPGREFGSVFIGNNTENLAVSVVASGWAKVRPAGGQQSPYYEQLAVAQAQAEAQGLGMWSKDPAVISKAVRQIPANDAGFDAAGLMAAVGRGKPLPAIVEAAMNGSMLRVTLLPDHQSVSVAVCGVQCPSMGRRPAPTAEGEPPAEPAQPEPFAREAKHFTETRALNREVRVVLEGVDKYGNLFGSVLYPHADEALNLGEQLVRAGLGRAVEWGLAMMSAGSQKLREAERTAKQARLNMWRNYVPPATANAKLSDSFTGVVAEVVSGDCLVVRDAASDVERRVTLSSIRAPRIGRREDKPEAYALEAREFLRQRLIGQEVAVSMEYTRKVQQPAGEAAAAAAPAAGAAGGAAAPGERVMSFGTVMALEKDKSGQQRQNNVAELLLVRGLATVVQHRSDDERSAHYQALLDAEQAGVKGRKGLHSKKEVPPHHVNDVSVPGAAQRAKQYLPFFQRVGRTPAVVEHVLSGHRLKLYVPKEGATIAFAPSGVRAPQRGMPARPGLAATQDEPYWQEALAFTRRHVLQRDVEVEVETVDRGGTFLGALHLPAAAGRPPFNLGLALLEAGLAKLHPSFDPERVPGGRDLLAAQAKAQAAQLKVWEGYVAPVEAAEGAAGHENGAANGTPESRETLQVVVTEVEDARSFWVQDAEEPRVSWLADQLAALALASQPPADGRLAAGSLCVAQFGLDQQWYRAAVDKAYTSDPIRPEYDVAYIDFGNRERVPASRVRPLEASLAAVPPQAIPATLAYLKVGDADDEHGADAARMLQQFAGNGKRLTALVERREPPAQPAKGKGRATRGRLHVLLCDPERASPGQSLNAELLRAGLARMAPSRGRVNKEVVEELAGEEEKARRAHAGLWVHGDPGSDEEDEAAPRPAGAWGRPR